MREALRRSCQSASSYLSLSSAVEMSGGFVLILLTVGIIISEVESLLIQTRFNLIKYHNKCSSSLKMVSYSKENMPNYNANVDELVIQKYPGSLDKHLALVLNADYTPLSQLPLSLVNWQDALRAILAGKAVVVSEYSTKVRSVSLEFTLPSVIALKHFHRVPDSIADFSRRNVFIRDNYKCAYCLQQYPSEGLSLDHVFPRCRWICYPSR